MVNIHPSFAEEEDEDLLEEEEEEEEGAEEAIDELVEETEQAENNSGEQQNNEAQVEQAEENKTLATAAQTTQRCVAEWPNGLQVLFLGKGGGGQRSSLPPEIGLLNTPPPSPQNIPGLVAG